MYWESRQIDAMVNAIRKDWGAIWQSLSVDHQTALVDAQVLRGLMDFWGDMGDHIPPDVISELRNSLHEALHVGVFASR